MDSSDTQVLQSGLNVGARARREQCGGAERIAIRDLCWYQCGASKLTAANGSQRVLIAPASQFPQSPISDRYSEAGSWLRRGLQPSQRALNYLLIRTASQSSEEEIVSFDFVQIGFLAHITAHICAPYPISARVGLKRNGSEWYLGRNAPLR
jgi:hypothetical protein